MTKLPVSICLGCLTPYVGSEITPMKCPACGISKVCDDPHDVVGFDWDRPRGDAPEYTLVIGGEEPYQNCENK